MLSENLKNLNTVEIREAIMKTDGEERLFYVQLFNHVMKLRREETLKIEQEQGNYNRKENYLRQEISFVPYTRLGQSNYR